MASLDTVWAELKGVGAGSLDELLPNGYSRTLAVDGLARVNPLMVEAGFAPDPALDTGFDYSLDEWLSYNHDGFPPVFGSCALQAQGQYAGVLLTWNLPAGYSRAPGLLRQRIDYKAGTETTDPTVSPDGTIFIGDETSYEVSLPDGARYAFVVRTLFNDSDEEFTPAGDIGYSPHASATPLVTVEGILTDTIYNTVPPTPTTQQLTPSNECAFGDTDVEVRCNYTLNGSGPMTLERQVNGGGWSPIVTGISANGSHTGQYGGNDEVEFRTYYEDVGPPRVYSAVATRQIFCENI